MGQGQTTKDFGSWGMPYAGKSVLFTKWLSWNMFKWHMIATMQCCMNCQPVGKEYHLRIACFGSNAMLQALLLLILPSCKKAGFNLQGKLLCDAWYQVLLISWYVAITQTSMWFCTGVLGQLLYAHIAMCLASLIMAYATDVRHYVSTCDHCQRNKASSEC